ncbi:hypothetical protein ACOCEA_14515 [Maribacter sp. CXY002]|uniref:hypothetical protein n=1 Tax=Maribacter luteocoastalis TaxID=3407671 RepID=UPI003B675B73
MKNLVLLFTAMILGTTGVFASGTNEDKVAIRNAYRYNNSFIFVENGITFSVYPDGEFDFYIEDYVTGRRNGITFNSGYDYSPYAQYDDYGAVIQVENVPIFYDYYGRVSQIGDVDINYRNGRVRRVGGMYVYYNNNGFYDYHTGYINIYNRNYVYRPYHRWFARPAINLCLVLNRPYRRYYAPVRYTYYSPYRYNNRRAYVKIGKEHRYNQVRKERANIYRNDRRVAVRDNAYRSNRTVANRTEGNKTQRKAVVNNNTHSNRGNDVSRTTTVKRNTTVARSNGNNGRATQGKTVTKREVTRTPSSTTVKRNTTTYRKPANNGHTVVQTRTTTRSSTSKAVNKAPTRPSSTVSRSTDTRSVSKAPSRSNTRFTTTRSSRRQ